MRRDRESSRRVRTASRRRSDPETARHRSAHALFVVPPGPERRTTRMRRRAPKRTSGDPQPSSLPNDRDAVAVARPIPRSTAPAMSKRTTRRDSERCAESTKSAATSASVPTGRLTKKIQRHERRSVRMPPSVGPVLTPSATKSPFIPSARPRCSGGNADVRRAGPIAMSSAAPMPCPARAAIKNGSDGARPHAAENPVNTTRPASQTLRWPTMSASRPAVISDAATTTR